MDGEKNCASAELVLNMLATTTAVISKHRSYLHLIRTLLHNVERKRKPALFSNPFTDSDVTHRIVEVLRQPSGCSPPRLPQRNATLQIALRKIVKLLVHVQFSVRG